METFAVNPPRWLWVLFSRNPLIRASDRLEALAAVVMLTLALLAIPIAGAVGTAVYDARSAHHAAQAQSRTAVTATVIDLPARSDPTRVKARWFAAGTEHTGLVQARSAPKVGESVEISVNPDGSYAGPPHLSAAREAVLVALAVWLNATAAGLLGYAGIRSVLNRKRLAGWRPELAHAPGSGREGVVG
ncbi:hypothetical protein BHQ23_06670 [Mycobacterium gordonae]|jgi:hypothetical protein|uniref:Transmembrane protein n=2 Tax=Mycobacteriaceae TaxID=1762 RepID=A0A1A6BLK0_MYCGO|nr:hypothetical protein A9W98_11100 [Mycobacterium gordonae]ODR22951.1 hypothetical protein BHQ23_06670 [Mycobacterium gordonae]ORV79447.1 hypothetical protein AWC08_30850 [Mycobacterium gordonae]